MLFAGSVFALLLAGLAVDGLLSPAGDEEEDLDDAPEDEAPGEAGGPGDSPLSNLLFNGDDADAEAGFAGATAAGAAALGYTPLDALGPEGELDAFDDGHFTSALDAEAALDADWLEAAGGADPDGDGDGDGDPDGDGDGAMIEIEATTALLDGTEVAHVVTFDTGTDSLVLEFEGSAAEAPVIEVEHDAEAGGAVVKANGLPVSLVDGATEMTADHVRVVMTGAEVVADAAVNLKADLPLVPDLVGDAGSLDPLGDALDDAIGDGSGDSLPDIGPDIGPDMGAGVLPDPAPVLDVVERLGEALPSADVVDQLLDDVAQDMAGLGSAADMLMARAALSDVFGDGGGDALTASPFGQSLSGGAGEDALFGGEGDDTLSGGGGNDEIHGDSGNDLLLGGDGVDFLDGGEGHDTLDGGAGRDVLFGGDGDDLLYGGAGDDILHGGRGADTLYGGSGNDLLIGTHGAGDQDMDAPDALWGGEGDDTIVIGQGDVAVGGAGADTFVSGYYTEAAEFAGTVADFDPREDRIEVLYDPAQDPDPVLEVKDFEDGRGADILLNGEVILSVWGAQGMDPALIELRAVA